jgi:hypothetical protein
MGRRFLDGFEDLFDNLRVKRDATMERNYHPASALHVNPMTAFGSQPNETAFNSIASESAAVKRGPLGMNFDCGGQNLPAQRSRALLVSQGFQEEFDHLPGY